MRQTADGAERRADTAMGEAFARAGVTAGEIAFRRALALFLNTGGTLAQARAILDAAETQMSAGGQPASAGTGRDAPAGRGAGDDGVTSSPPQGHVNSAPSSPGPDPAAAGGGGHLERAGDGQIPSAPTDSSGATKCEPQGQDTTAPDAGGAANSSPPQGHQVGAAPPEIISQPTYRDTRGRFQPHPNAVRGMSRDDRQALVSVKSDLARTSLATKIGEFGCLLRNLSWEQVAAAGERNTARGLFFAGLWTLKAEGARTVGDCVTDDDLKPLVAMAERKAQVAFARLMAS